MREYKKVDDTYTSQKRSLPSWINKEDVAKGKKERKKKCFVYVSNWASRFYCSRGREEEEKMDALREKKKKITCSTYFTSIFSIRAVLNRERESIPALL